MHKQFTTDNADNEQTGLFKMFGDLNKGKKSSEKIFSLKQRKHFTQSDRR